MATLLCEMSLHLLLHDVRLPKPSEIVTGLINRRKELLDLSLVLDGSCSTIQ
jgi:hypothetical protein